jgi:DNA-binding NarL/FixJ family response regulator
MAIDDRPITTGPAGAAGDASPGGRARIAIVEDDPGAHDRLAAAIAGAQDMVLVASAANLADGLALVDAGGYDVLVCDLGLPDGSGIGLIRRSAQLWPDAEVLVVTVFADHAKVFDSIRAGATGYVLKDEGWQGLAGRIREVVAGGSPISPGIARRILRRMQPARPDDEAGADGITAREANLLSLLARGLTYAEIGRALDVTDQTVATYIKRIYRKLHVNSRGEAVYEASQRGLIDPI